MRRSTLILVLLFLLSVLLFWYSHQAGNPITQVLSGSTNTPAASQDFLISPNKGPVSLVSITDSTGRTVKIDRSSGQWMVTTDQAIPADPAKAESAAGQALKLTIWRKLDSNPDPAGTGLNEPEYKISIGLGDGSTFNFAIGKVTVTGTGYYAEQNGKVYILEKNDVDALTIYFSDPPVPGTATLPPNSGIGTSTPGVPGTIQP